MFRLELILLGQIDSAGQLASDLDLGLLPLRTDSALKRLEVGPGGLILLPAQMSAWVEAHQEKLNRFPYGVLVFGSEPIKPPLRLKYWDLTEPDHPELTLHRAKGLLERIWLHHRVGERHLELKETTAAANNERAVLCELQRQLREARDLAQKEAREKSELLNFLAHEIRTPINGVMGMVHLFSHTAMDREQQEFITALSRSGESLLEMVNGLLDWGRLEAGKVELQPREFDLWAMLDELRMWFLPLAEEKGLTVEIKAAEGFSGWLVGDQPKLRQILVNLMGNALKFTESGGLTLSVAPQIEGGQVTGMSLRVKDTGRGIAADQIPRLFDPFWQVEEFGSRGNQGSGLGLAIVKRLVEIMRGQLRVTSEAGEGTCFELVLPLKEVLRNRAEVSRSVGADREDFALTGEIYLMALERHLRDGAWPEARDLVGRFERAGQKLGFDELSLALCALDASLGREESAANLAQLEEVERHYRNALDRLSYRQKHALAG
ncbi:MAG: ATP-binding protein [bacterium]|nr:ATP-binding protein [bacterium]